MRKEDLSKAIGGIDPKLVESSMAYRPATSKHRLTKIVALAACLAVIVTAIPLSLIMNREDQVETPETTLTPGKDSTTNSVIVDPTPLKVIYCGSSSVSPEYLETTVFKDKNIKVEDFEPYLFRYKLEDVCEILDWTPDIPEKLTLSLSNKEYTANFDIAYRYTNSDNEVLNAYAKMARYKVEGTEKGYLYYRIETKTIVQVEGLPISSASSQQYSPKYNKEEILEIACQDIKSIYGEEILEEHYAIKHLAHNSGAVHIVVFKRMIGDYDTGSVIEMMYNGEGELKYCITDKLGLYDFAEHLLTIEKLLEVEEEARQLIGKDFVAEKKLMLHKDGYVCVSYILYLGYNETGSITGTTYLYFRLE